MSQQEPAKVHPIKGGAAAANAPDSKPERTRAKPNYVLPTDRITCEKQLVLLRGYAAVSGHNKKPAKLNEVAEVSKISANTISNANGFFLEIGLLQKTDAGFLPAEEVAAFALAYEWSAATAAVKLAPIIRRSWFAERVIPKLSMGSVHEKELIDDLAMAAAVGPDFRPRIKLLLDFLEVSGVAERDGDNLKKGANAGGASVAPAPAVDRTTTLQGAEIKETAPRDGQPIRSGVNTAFTQMTGGAIQFNISVKVDMDEFAGWRPDRITAFFGGIAAVLSAKAAVEKAASNDE
jgi:hypothetical protein